MNLDNVNADCYDSKTAKQFCNAMKRAGLKVRHYHGRFFWQGPAVGVSHISEAMSKTRVECQYDQLGLGFIVYPIEKAELKSEISGS